MTIELAFCIFLALLVYPVSKSISVHYVLFALANLAFVGASQADSSLLAMVFALLAIGDMVLGTLAKRYVLLFVASVSSLLCIEQVANQDFLLNYITEISIITNAAILASLAAEYWAWMRGKFGR